MPATPRARTIPPPRPIARSVRRRPGVRDSHRQPVRLDRHRFTVELRAGVNTVLVKVCQAPASDNGPPNWEFLLRVTDSTGRGVKFPSALKAR